MTNDVQTSTPMRGGGTSKLALLISFIAGAFAAWIVISLNTSQSVPEETDQESAPAMVAPVPHRPPSAAKGTKTTPGVTVTNSASHTKTATK